MSISRDNKSYLSGDVNVYTTHDGVTDDDTSVPIDITGAKKIALVFTEANQNSTEEADLTVDVSVDGSNFYDYSMLIDNTTNSNVQTLTRVASKTLNSDSTAILWMTPETLGGFTYLKTDVAVTNKDLATFTVKVAICY